MKNDKWSTALAVLSGLLLTLSFPPMKAPWLAWIALIPLLKSISGKPGREAFTLGLVAGLAHYFSLMYWIVVVLGHYGGLPLPASIGVLALFCLYLALYPALFALLARGLQGSRLQILGSAALWTSTELLRSKALTGFPWSLLAHSQFSQLPLIQVSDLFGTYAISFLLVSSNVLLYLLLFDFRSFSRPFRKAEAVAVVVLLSATLVYGMVRLEQFDSRDELQKTARIAVVQGNIDQSVKWNPQYQERTLEIYETLTRRAADFNPDLVLWPETAVPFFFQEENELSKRVAGVSRQPGRTFIFGSPAYGVSKEVTQFYNRAYILWDGKVHGYYDKIHLVPFGEYVPLKSLLFFVNRLVPAAGDFASGNVLNPLRGPGFSSGILICFEVVFPELARGQVQRGADILINLTNDAWFGKTSAPYQHLSMAAFRAVENRRPLVRAANTGISGFIRPTGEITGRSDLFRRDLLTAEVAFGPPQMSLYTRHGDIFALFLFAFSVVQIILNVWYRKQNSATKTRRHKARR
ncbi:MAG: apolipoprotein N-acyltransferase [Deltaproteobacteria bacterium HGW-Deltaproteobacteria-21]|nr:MAG: apolipoprotein N-acyltransferase [Deltaproteobacteria bacterium HGW-Deltaproteobacteria-21]